MFVNTCICPVNSFLSSIITSLRARTFTNKHVHTHAPISVHTHAFTSHIYYLNHVVCFTICSCILLCVFSFFAVLLSYMICTIMEEIKNIYLKYYHLLDRPMMTRRLCLTTFHLSSLFPCLKQTLYSHFLKIKCKQQNS